MKENSPRSGNRMPSISIEDASYNTIEQSMARLQPQESPDNIFKSDERLSPSRVMKTRVTFATSSGLDEQQSQQFSKSSDITFSPNVTLQESNATSVGKKSTVPVIVTKLPQAKQRERRNLTYFCGTNEFTKKGKAILITMAVTQISVGIYAVITGAGFVRPTFCIGEPTISMWIIGHGCIGIICGIGTTMRLKIKSDVNAETANFLKWVMFSITSIWLTAGTVTLTILMMKEDVLDECDDLLVQTFIWVTVFLWVGLLTFLLITVIRYKQTTRNYKSVTHMALMKNMTLFDFSPKSNVN